MLGIGGNADHDPAGLETMGKHAVFAVTGQGLLGPGENKGLVVGQRRQGIVDGIDPTRLRHLDDDATCFSGGETLPERWPQSRMKRQIRQGLARAGAFFRLRLFDRRGVEHRIESLRERDVVAVGVGHQLHSLSLARRPRL